MFSGSKNDLPESVLRKTEAWTRCVSRAMEREEYEGILKRAGFEDVSVEVTNVYDPEAVERLSGPEELEALRKVPAASAFIRARKPAREPAARRESAWLGRPASGCCARTVSAVTAGAPSCRRTVLSGAPASCHSRSRQQDTPEP